MVVTAEVAEEALTAAVAVAFTAVVEVAASTAAVATTADRTAAIGQVLCTEAVAVPEGWGENQHQPATPARQEVRLHRLVPTPRRDGTRLVDLATAAARSQLMKWELLTVSGTPSEAPTRQLDQRSQPTRTSLATQHSCAAVPGAPEVGAAAGAAGVVVGVTRLSVLDGDAGVADGRLALDGASAGALIGRSTRILIGAACGGVVLTTTILRPTTFTPILTRMGATYH